MRKRNEQSQDSFRGHSCSKKFVQSAALFAAVLLPNMAKADLFHYSNLLIGQKALGLGGAFTALSDDTSGLFYNPGGFSFQNNTELSGSMNTFYLKKTTFDNVFGEKSFTESARGIVSSFFGMSKKISPPLLGNMQIGIAFINPDAALSDENVLFENEPDPNVIRYHRAANIRTGTSQIMVGASKRIGRNNGIGCAASYLDIDELEQIFQDVVQGPLTSTELPNATFFSTLGQNVRTHLLLRGGSLRCGIRTSFASGLSLGVSYQRVNFVYQNFEYDFEINKVFTDAQGKIITNQNSENTMFKGQLLRNTTRINDDNFVTLWPDELRLGIAFQSGKSLLVSADVIHFGPGDGTNTRVKRASVVNYALGTELILGNTVFIRSGYFTNKDATISRDLNNPNQRKEYIDYQGVSLSTGLKFNTGDYGIHYTEQRGKGMAEKVSGKRNPSTGRLQVISVSATQSFQ